MRNTVGKTEGQHPTLNPLTSLGCYQNRLMCFTKSVGFSLKLAPKVHQQIVREGGHSCQALVNPSVCSAIFIFVHASILSCQVVILGCSWFPQPYKVFQQHPDNSATQYSIPKSASVYCGVSKSKHVIPRSFNLWSDQVVLIFPLDTCWRFPIHRCDGLLHLYFLSFNFTRKSRKSGKKTQHFSISEDVLLNLIAYG